MRSGKVVLAGLFAGVAALTALLAWLFDGAHNGRIAGNEAMVIAGAWGLSGLAAAAMRGRGGPADLRNGARILFAAGLLYLVLGALLGNSRWAEPWARLIGYAGALGSVWAGEWLLMGGGDGEDADAGRLVALTAGAAGLGALAFEVVRWLEPAFTLAMGTVLTPEIHAQQQAVRGLWTAAVWAPYGLAVLAVSVRFGSQAGLRLGAGALAAAWAYSAFSVLRHTFGPGWLMGLAGALLIGSTVAGGALYRLWRKRSQEAGQYEVRQRPPA